MNMIDQLNIKDFQVFTDENSDKSVSKIELLTDLSVVSFLSFESKSFFDNL